MLIEDYIIAVFIFVDDQMKKLTEAEPLRKRGFKPAFSDSEVITMEIVVEFLRLDTEKGIWEYFK